MDWTKQGAAVYSRVELTTGKQGKVVIVGARENPKGAVVVIADTAPGGVDTQPLEAHIDHLSPAVVAEIMCMQERLHGASGLPAPHFP